MDYISDLPECILETIVSLLPIKEAARTSVLSRDWRYIWTGIPNLVFDENMFHVSDDGDDLFLSEEGVFNKNTGHVTDDEDDNFHSDDDQECHRERMDSCKLLFSIFRVLFSHTGRIHEFALSMKAYKGYIGIDVILSHLSRKKTVKKLTLKCYPGYQLPLSFFTLNQLTDLYLSGCEFDLMPRLSGFGGLTSLFLEESYIGDEFLIDILSMSPLLKTLTIKEIDYTDYATITKLFECLPVIENLTLRYDLLQCYASEDQCPQKLQTALVHLKYLCVERVCFTEDSEQHILVPVITSSPNLKKLKVEIMQVCCGSEQQWLTLKDYSDIRFEHLTELDVINVSNRNFAELDFVKLILAKSPVLKKVRIVLCNGVSDAQIWEILNILSCSSITSLMVEITVECY